MSEGSYENSAVVGRHFEDENDIADGLDTHLQELTEEGNRVLDENAEEILRDTERKGLNKIIIVSSTRRRALLTSELVEDKIHEKSPEIGVRIQPDPRFREIDQGNIVLPEGYKPGDHVEFISRAWEVFWEETFDTEGNYNNPNYKFGNPVGTAEEDARHPELIDRYSSFGESYRELCLRYYEGIVEYFENIDRVNARGFNVVLIAHGATLGIIKQLQDVAADLDTGTYQHEKGDLMKECWNRYLTKLRATGTHSSFGSMETFELSNVGSNAIELLKEEIEYMKDPKNYEKQE